MVVGLLWSSGDAFHRVVDSVASETAGSSGPAALLPPPHYAHPLAPLTHQVTLLHIAILRRDLKACKKVIQMGHADPYFNSGRVTKPCLTAFQLAALLFRAAADEIPCHQFDTPAEQACFTGNRSGSGVDGDEVEDDLSAHFAAAAGHTKCLKLFKRERLQTRDTVLGLHPVECAAANGQMGTVEWLTKNASDMDPILARSCMKWAAWGGHLKVVQWLYQQGGGNQISSEEGDCSAMLVAAGEGHLSVVLWLIKKAGSSLEEADWYGRTALTWAALKGHSAVVQWVYQEGPETIKTKHDMTGKSPVLVAATGGDLDVLQWLLINGEYSVKETDYVGKTALLLAASNGHLKMVQWLILGGGSSPNEEDERGNTAISLAASQGHADIVYWLVQEAGVSAWDVPSTNDDIEIGMLTLKSSWSYNSHYLFPRSYRVAVTGLLWVMNWPQPNPDTANPICWLDLNIMRWVFEFLPSDALPDLLEPVQPKEEQLESGRNFLALLSGRRSKRDTHSTAELQSSRAPEQDEASVCMDKPNQVTTARGASLLNDESSEALPIFSDSSPTALHGRTSGASGDSGSGSSGSGQSRGSGDSGDSSSGSNPLSVAHSERSAGKRGYLKYQVSKAKIKMTFCMNSREESLAGQTTDRPRNGSNGSSSGRQPQQLSGQSSARPRRMQYQTQLHQVGNDNIIGGQSSRRTIVRSNSNGRRQQRLPPGGRLVYYPPQQPRGARAPTTGGLLARQAFAEPGPSRPPVDSAVF